MTLTESELRIVYAFLYLIVKHYGRMAKECEEKCSSECTKELEEETGEECQCDATIRLYRAKELWAAILRENIDERMGIEPDEIERLLSECRDQMERSDQWVDSDIAFGSEARFHKLVSDSGEMFIEKLKRHLQWIA